MAAAAEEALVKIGAVLPEAARQRAEAVQIHAYQMPGLSPEVRALIDRLERAANGQVRLSLLYHDESGAETRREVRPLGLWFWGKVWTLVAWCELRRDFRMFRLDRMREVAEAGPFRPERGQSLRDFYATLPDRRA